MKLNYVIKLAVFLGISSINAHAEQTVSTRIIGGEQADTSTWSFIVPLVTKGMPAYDGQFCGGSLINSSYVLTAAHCVEGKTADDLEVIIGIYDLSDESTSTRVGVKTITAHEDYNVEGYGNNDIALLELSEVVTESPIELATPSVLGNINAGDTVTVAGWGNLSTTTTDYPDILQQVDLPYVDRATCQALSAGGYADIDETAICAGYQDGGYDSCQGDSGGPLIIDDNGTSKLLGIVSWGDGCAQPDAFGVYANATYFQGNDWINTHMLLSYSQSIDLGYIKSEVQHVEILTIGNNDTTQAVNILNITPSNGVSILDNNCLESLETGDSCTVSVGFTPSQMEENEGIITFKTDHVDISEFTTTIQYQIVEPAANDVVDILAILDANIYSNSLPWVAISDGVQSGDIGDDEESIIVLDNLSAGTLSFDFLVSSEEDYDFATILVNDEIYLSTSGSNEYAISIPLSEESNTVVFVYSKDSYVSENDDAIYIRNLSLSTAGSTSDDSSSASSNSSSGGSMSYAMILLLSLCLMLKSKGREV